MFSEEVMGLIDYLYRRAPNASAGFIDEKVKSAKNKTMCWLDSQSTSAQQSIISFAITQGSKMRKVWKKRSEHIFEVKKLGTAIKRQNVDASARRKIE